MMMKRFAAMAALASLVMFAASMAAAQEKEVKVTIVAEDEASAPRAGAMKLTDEQRAKVDELRTEQRLRTIELRADLAKLGVELKRETGKSEPDMEAVEAVLKKMSAVRERIQMSRIEHGMAMKKLLGDGWRSHARRERGEKDTMWIGAGECEEHGDRDVRVIRFKDREGAARQGADGRRLGGMAVVPHAKASGHAPGSPAMMKHVRKGIVPKASCPAHDARGGKALRARSARKVCSGSCAAHKSNWESRMFRPRGKKTEHRCVCGGRHVEWRHEMPAEGRRMKASGGR
jgi:Spy/CpxP family protein refolding chaperone